MGKETWYCKWCGKHRTKKPVREQKDIMNEEWNPLCSYCSRKRDNMFNNPFNGIIAIEIRDIKTRAKP